MHRPLAIVVRYCLTRIRMVPRVTLLFVLAISLVWFVLFFFGINQRFQKSQSNGRHKYFSSSSLTQNPAENEEIFPVPLADENNDYADDEQQEQNTNNNITSMDNFMVSQLPIQQQIPVLVIAAKRPKAIANHLDQLKRLRSSAEQFPIIVSQDGSDQQVSRAVQEHGKGMQRLLFIKHIEEKRENRSNYFHIASHYKWALDKIFRMGFANLIITEDDLDISKDFFAYFNATKRLLYDDPTIWCISAWNDNGNPSLVDWEGGIGKLWRTDFFPGLGWMLRADLWRELSPKWPEAFWDDWLRQNDIRKDRVCIRPEISRTAHNLEVAGKGSSNGLYKNFLSSIRLSEKEADFPSVNLTLLEKNNFDAWIEEQLAGALEISLEKLLNNTPSKEESAGRAYKVVYRTPKEFRQLTKKFNMMSDIRSGMARTAYLGCVPFFSAGVQFFAVHLSLSDWLLKAAELGELSGARHIYRLDWDLMSKFLDFAELYCTPNKWAGKCDPKDEEMRKWFRSKGWLNRLQAWGNMTVI